MAGKTVKIKKYQKSINLKKLKKVALENIFLPQFCHNFKTIKQFTTHYNVIQDSKGF